MPAFGVVQGQRVHFVPIGRRKESGPMVIVGLLSRSLNKLEQTARVTLGHVIGSFQGGKSSPPAGELLRRNSAQLVLQRAGVFHRHQEIEGRLPSNPLEQLRRQVFQVRHHQGLAGSSAPSRLNSWVGDVSVGWHG